MLRLLLTSLIAVALLAQADPAVIAKQGRQALAEGRFDEAAGLYGQLVERIPDNPGLLLNLGMALHMAGKDEQAIPPLEKALSIDSRIYPALLFLGASHLRQERPREAAEALKKAVAVEPGDAQSRQLLADAYTQLGRLRDAAPQRERVAALTPDDPFAWGALIQTYEGVTDEAFQALEQSAPESPWMLRLLADLRVSQQQYPSAFYLYSQALERAPEMRGLHAGLADVYRGTGKDDWAAAEDRKEAAAPAPDCTGSSLECAFSAGKLDEVALARGTNPEEHYWRAKAASALAARAFLKLKALPDSPPKYELLASIHGEQGRHQDAADAWRKALDLEPSNPIYAQELASQLYLARRFDEARPRLESLVKSRPNEPRWSFLLGDLHLQQQSIEEAIPLLERAATQAPDLLPAHHALGRAYLQAGRPADAVPELEAALSIDLDGSLHYQLAQAYIQTGRRDAAAAPLAKYRELQQTQQAQLEQAQEMEITAPAP